MAEWHARARKHWHGSKVVVPEFDAVSGVQHDNSPFFFFFLFFDSCWLGQIRANLGQNRPIRAEMGINTTKTTTETCRYGWNGHRNKLIWSIPTETAIEIGRYGRFSPKQAEMGNGFYFMWPCERKKKKKGRRRWEDTKKKKKKDGRRIKVCNKRI